MASDGEAETTVSFIRGLRRRRVGSVGGRVLGIYRLRGLVALVINLHVRIILLKGLHGLALSDPIQSRAHKNGKSHKQTKMR